MKKLKHEAELFKGALLAGVKYAEGPQGRGRSRTKPSMPDQEAIVVALPNKLTQPAAAIH